MLPRLIRWIRQKHRNRKMRSVLRRVKAINRDLQSRHFTRTQRRQIVRGLYRQTFGEGGG